MANMRSRGLLDYELNRVAGIEWDETDEDREISEPFDRTVNLLDDAADGTVTLWDSVVHVWPDGTSVFKWLVVQVDPAAASGGGKSEVLWVNIELTIGGNVVVVQVSRLAPLVFSVSTAGAAGVITSVAGAITKVRGRNLNSGTSPPVEGNRDVLVRTFVAQ